MSESLPTGSDLPTALTSRDQWLCWRAEERDGKVTKVPINPISGKFASTTDSETWSDIQTAINQARNGSVDGIGFVFTDEDPIVGVDLDDCRIPETGKPREWATDIITRLDSFTEVSPSGTGYHVLVEGSLPDDRNRKGDIECYETARFFTVTGDHVDGTPMTVESRVKQLKAVHREYLREDGDSDVSVKESTGDNFVIERTDTDTTPGSSLPDQDLIERAKNAANGEKFDRLWRGNTAGYESHSEADMALCSLLAFWTGGDSGQLDRLFRESGLIRDKWDERHFADGSTYGKKTIERAIAGTDEFYEPTQEGSTAAGSSETKRSDSVSSETSVDRGSVRERASDRLERIEELETELQETLDETGRLRSELEAERERRRELEAELGAIKESPESESWLPWR